MFPCSEDSSLANTRTCEIQSSLLLQHIPKVPTARSGALLQEGECPWCQKYPYERMFYTVLISAEEFLGEFWHLGIRNQRRLPIGSGI